MELVHDLARTLCDEHADEAARLLEEVDARAVAGLFAELPPDAAGSVLPQMAPLHAVEVLGGLAPEAAGPILEALSLDDAARCLRPLGAEAREARLDRLSKSTAEALRALVGSAPGTAGALMDPRALALPEDYRVGEALVQIRSNARFLRHYLYVVARESGSLVGVASLRMLLLAEADTRLASLMSLAEERIAMSAGAEAILAHPAWRRFPVMPVVDDRGVFAGAIRYEAVRRHAAAEEGGGAERSARTTIASLGELWWIGVAGMLAGLVTPVAPPEPRRKMER